VAAVLYPCIPEWYAASITHCCMHMDDKLMLHGLVGRPATAERCSTNARNDGSERTISAGLGPLKPLIMFGADASCERRAQMHLVRGE
jgi:hypothetical protein